MIDSHCHLNFDNLSKDFSSIIKRAKKNNITAILSINTNPDKFESHYQLIKKYKSLFISYGLHPENVNSFNIPTADSLKFYCEYEQVIGIGETGLDFYRSTEHKLEQYQTFENHIECSYKTNLPLIIHQRNSEKEIIEVLKNYQKSKPLKVVFHCFTGSEKLKNFCLDNEFYISLSGIITFKNANELREVINNFPLQQILIETDSPFLAPVPFRGKMNEPSYVKYISKYLSDFYDISQKEFNEITDNNFYKLFSKAIRYNEIS
jgi:TatD DNase family protein|tara:strand:+ start:1435 stop:2223 length:789 start_codon:yes stop_codon:yes gene_type:complete